MLLYRAGYLALTSSTKNYRIAAFVFKNRKHIYGKAVNLPKKKHPIQKKYAYKVKKEKREHLHAEVKAIIRAKGKGDSILVVRILKNKKYAMARPCKICMEAIRETHIKHLWYTGGEGELHYERVG